MAKPKPGDMRAEAFKPTPQQYEDGDFPPYAQIVLRIPTSPARNTTCEHYLDNGLAWEVRDALAQVQTPEAGKSIIEQLEAELDGVMDELMANADGPLHADYQAWGELRGQAQGLARAVALLRSMSYDAVKAAALDRWEDRNTTEEARA